MSSLSFVIGQRLREIRRDHSVSADAVAQTALVFGLRWDRTIVSKIERGDRALSIDELFLLPVILDRSDCGYYPIRQLIPETEFIQIGDTFSSGRTLHSLMGFNIHREEQEADALAKSTESPDSQRIKNASMLDAERKAARNLGQRIPGMTAERVARLAYHVWGESLTEHRDRLVSERYPSDLPAKKMQSARGHVTRTLVKSLEEYLEALKANNYD